MSKKDDAEQLRNDCMNLSLENLENVLNTAAILVFIEELNDIKQSIFLLEREANKKN